MPKLVSGTIIVQVPFTYNDKTLNEYIGIADDAGVIHPQAEAIEYTNSDIVHITTDNWKPINNIKVISFPDLTKVEGSRVLYQAYAHNSMIEVFSAPQLKEIVGEYACYGLLDCNGDVSIGLHTLDISNLEKIEGTSACYSAFGFHPLLTGHLDLHNLKTVSGRYACYWMFYKNPYTSVDLSGLETVNGERAFSTVFSGADFSEHPINLKSLKSVSGTQCLYQTFSNCGISRATFGALKEIRGTGNRFFNQTFSSYSSDPVLVDAEIIFDVLETIYDSGSASYPMFYQMTGSSKVQRKVYFPSLKTVTASYSINSSNHPFKNMINGSYSTAPHEVHFPIKFSSRASSWTIANCNKYFDIVTEITVNDVVYNRSEENAIRDENCYRLALCWIDENDNRIYTPFDDRAYTKVENKVGDTVYSDPECTESVGTISSIG